MERHPDPLVSQLHDLGRRVSACEARLGLTLERAASTAPSNLSISKFGSSGGRTLAEAAAEVSEEGAQLMLREGAVGSSRLVRVVDTMMLRLNSPDDSGRILVETGTVGPPRLPGTRKLRHESPEESLARIQQNVLGAAGCRMRFSLDKTDTFSEELEPDSPRGFQTLERVRIVEGHVVSSDPQALVCLGLAAAEGGEAGTGFELGSSCFEWLTEAQALERRVRLRGDDLGALSAPLLLPVGDACERPRGTLSAAVTEVSAKVDAAFQKERRLPDLHRGLTVLGPWLECGHGCSPCIVQERARRAYLAQHAAELRDFARVLQEVERLKPAINPPALQDLSGNGERLQRLEARSAVATGAAVRLHGRVVRVAEEYHQSMLAINAQLLRWDALLSHGQ